MNARSILSFLVLTLVLAPSSWARTVERLGDRQHLQGSWVGTITATEPELPPFQDLLTFTRDGSVIESRRLYVTDTPFGPLLETGGHGAWVRTGNASFTVRFVFFLQSAPDNPTDPGAPFGTDTIRLDIRLGRDNRTFSGTFVSQVQGLDGTLLFEARGTVTGERILALE